MNVSKESDPLQKFATKLLLPNIQYILLYKKYFIFFMLTVGSLERYTIFESSLSMASSKWPLVEPL